MEPSTLDETVQWHLLARMVPFVEPDFVKSVDFDAGLITVDWDPDF